MLKKLQKSIISLVLLTLTSCVSNKYTHINVDMTEKDEKVLEAYGFYNQKSLNEDYWYLWKEELLARQSGYVDMQITTMGDKGEIHSVISKSNYSNTYGYMEHISSFTPKDNEYDKIILYIHGGAFITEALTSHAKYCDNLSYLNNALVVAPNYPLAPQGTYVEAYKMLDETYDAMLKEKKPIYIFGDSAGGGLALSYTLYLKEKRMKLPKKVVAISPWVDLATDNPKIEEQLETDRMLHPYGLKEAGKWWCGDLPGGAIENKLELNDYRVSPKFGNYKHFPETLVFSATYEIFYPDLCDFVEILKENKVKTTFVELNGFMHVTPLVESFSCYEYLLNIVTSFLNNEDIK